METIAIKVDAEVAKAYQAAEPQKQQKIQTIVNDLLKLIIQDKSLDDKFLEVAMNGNATHIITGDKDLLELHPFQEVDIITAT